jgi:hypothetical protein
MRPPDIGDIRQCDLPELAIGSHRCTRPPLSASGKADSAGLASGTPAAAGAKRHK